MSEMITTFIEGIRSKRMEQLTLQILVEAIKQVNPAWNVEYREDDESWLGIGVQDEDGVRTPIARIYIVAVDETGGEIDKTAGEALTDDPQA